MSQTAESEPLVVDARDLLDEEVALEEVGSDDDLDYPLIPWCDTTDDEFGVRWVDYVDRGPRDVVVSGPVTGGWGPGRWSKNRRIAYWRLVGKYGIDRVKQTRQSEGRWSFLVRGLRAPTAGEVPGGGGQ